MSRRGSDVSQQHIDDLRLSAAKQLEKLKVQEQKNIMRRAAERTRMASFESLATELLLQIISYLESPLDLASLSISLVRRGTANFPVAKHQVHYHIEPLLESLFRRITIRGSCNVRQTQDFILSIIEQPRLAHYVQYVCAVDEEDYRVECDCREWIYGDEGVPIPSEEPYPHSPRKESLFRKAIKAHKSIWNTPAKRYLLLEALKNSNCGRCGYYGLNGGQYKKYQFHDAAIAILEPLLSKEHTLELGSTRFPMTSKSKSEIECAFFYDVVNEGLSTFKELVLSDECPDCMVVDFPQSPHEGLHGRMFRPGRDLTPYDLLRIFHIAKVPSLRKISGRRIYCPEQPYLEDGKYTKQLFAFPARFSNIIELDLRCCHLDDMVFKALCRLPKSLEILRLSTQGGENVWDSEAAIHNLSIISEALQYHTKSLRILELDLDFFLLSPFEGQNPLGDLRSNCIGSFKDFQALKVLAIGFMTFLMEVEDGFDDVDLKDPEDDDFDDDNPLHVMETYTHPFSVFEAFPPSLEVLVIYDFEKENVPRPPEHSYETTWFNQQNSDLLKLWEKRAELYPNLKTIRGIDEPLQGERACTLLDEICEEIGMPLI